MASYHEDGAYALGLFDIPTEENPTPVTPATQFHIITQVVMIEFESQRDEPPGRAPYREVKTVLTERSTPIKREQLAARIRDVQEIA
jgi:hypothetical protein